MTKNRRPGSQEAVKVLREFGFDVYGLGTDGRVSVPPDAAVKLGAALRREFELERSTDRAIEEAMRLLKQVGITELVIEAFREAINQNLGRVK